MATLMLMGGATFIIGCIPSYETIGYAAPIIVLILRLLQGLALGGEYGGAATYVAEHAPKNEKPRSDRGPRREGPRVRVEAVLALLHAIRTDGGASPIVRQRQPD